MRNKPATCPECSEILEGERISCAHCGWSRRKEKRFGTKAHDGRCDYRANGERCAFAGSISDSTKGGGPWYCRFHDGCRDSMHGARIVEASQSEEPVTRESRNAAHMARVRADLKAMDLAQMTSETKHGYAKRLQAHCLGKFTKLVASVAFEREPGQDDEEQFENGLEEETNEV